MKLIYIKPTIRLDGIRRLKMKQMQKKKKERLKIFSILRQSEENSLLENDDTDLFFFIPKV
jgi:hypothetical protein